MLKHLAEEAQGVDTLRFALACHSHLPPEVKRDIIRFRRIDGKKSQGCLRLVHVEALCRRSSRGCGL